MAFELPELKYSFTDLEPVIDARTVEIHHDKHHATYLKNLNTAFEKFPEFYSWTLEKILAKIESDAENDAAIILAEAEVAASHFVEEQMLVSQKREAERLETANVSANAILSRGKAAAEAERK